MNAVGGADYGSLQRAIASTFENLSTTHIGVAVSGGSDSMALLSLVSHWARGRGIRCSAVTVDHGLRAEAADEASMVAAFCAARGISHDILHWRGWDGTGNLQAMARVARYGLIADWALSNGVETVALGHTQDDQAETFLMRLARQSGVDGLAKMRAQFQRGGVGWVRPLLDLSRHELRNYLKQCAINWIEDPSNEDPSFDRVRVRDTLTLMEPLGITRQTLSSVSDAMGAAREALEHYTALEAQAFTSQDGGDLIISRPAERHIPPEIARRILSNALQWVGNSEYPPRASAIAELEDRIQTSPRHSLAGCVVVKEDHGLRIAREFNAVRDQTSATDALWDQRWQLEGAHDPRLQIKALGEAGLRECPDWRATGRPRLSLLATPSIWHEKSLVAAPLAGLENGWQARLTRSFVAHLRNKSG